MSIDNLLEKSKEFLNLTTMLVGEENTAIIAKDLPPWLKSKPAWKEFVTFCKTKTTNMWNEDNKTKNIEAYLYILPGNKSEFKTEGMCSFLTIQRKQNSYVPYICFIILIFMLFRFPK